MVAKKQKKVRKGSVKKKWFTAVAPPEFNNKEIAEITAYEPDELIGRTVETNLMMLTGSPKDQGRWIYFKITEVKGEKAYTANKRLIASESYVQRTARRFKHRFLTSLIIETKDKQKIQIKVLGLAIKHVHKPLQTALLAKLNEQIKEKISKENINTLFTPMTVDRMLIEIRKDLKTIYPIDKILLHKLIVK